MAEKNKKVKSKLTQQTFKEVEKTKWIFASKNTDDDFHTDILFHRAATEGMRFNCGHAYNSTIALYKGFIGEFYYPREETRKVCQSLIKKLKENPELGFKINQKIRKLSDHLGKVFAKISTEENFSDFSDQEILKLYNEQYRQHCLIYNACWVGETLQARNYGLTNYLLEYLFSLLKSKELAKKVLFQLSAPRRITEFGKEEYEIIKLAKIILTYKIIPKANRKTTPSQLASIIPNNFVGKFKAIYLKYAYLHYHGFGNRKLPEQTYIAQKILEYIKKPNLVDEKLKSYIKKKNVDQQKRLIFKKLKIDHVHQSLFIINAEFCFSKAYRRLAELKNFYYLDRLMDQIARRKKFPRPALQFLFPEEIIDIINNKIAYSKKYERRSKHFIYYYKNNQEYFCSGLRAQVFQNRFKKLNSETISYKRIIHGQPASLGFATGKAIQINGVTDKRLKQFKKGNILVGIDLDPTLIPWIKKAGAVVVDQGGVTCHAAIAAREFQIPCITGTKIISRLIKNGDYIKVNANKGKVII